VVARRALALVLVFSYLVFSAPFSLGWYSVETRQLTIKLSDRNATAYVPVPAKVKGYLEGLAPGSLNQTLLCLSSSEPLAAVAIVKVDVQRGRDVALPRYYALRVNGGTVCTPVYLGYVRLEGGSLLDLAKVLYSTLKLAAGDVTGLTGLASFLLKPQVRGAYLEVALKGDGGALLTHYFYEYKVERPLECLKVRAPSLPLVPGARYNLTLVNGCGREIVLKLYLDVANAGDVGLGTVSLEPGKAKNLTVYLPKAFGVRHEKLKFEERYMTSLIMAEREEYGYATVKALPVFDYLLFFVTLRENYNVTWYQGGREVNALEPGEALVCLNLTSTYLDLDLQHTRFRLYVSEDRRLLPDLVVAEKYFYADSFEVLQRVLEVRGEKELMGEGLQAGLGRPRLQRGSFVLARVGLK